MANEEPPAESFSCEEILLPAISNGEAAVDNEGTEEYLEENDPMSEEAGTSQAEDNITEGEDSQAELPEDDQNGENDDGDNDDGENYDDDDDEDDEDTQETELKTTATTTLPKKRKEPISAAHDSLEEVRSEKNSMKKDSADVNTEANAEVASSSKRRENQVDEEQCRVCTTKEDLISLFKPIEKQQTIADMLMTICPNVSIALKDFMPQFICNPCWSNVQIAVQLKVQCETTERELRKKLSRGKNKVRRPRGYVTIDATIDSDPPSEEELNDDVEFKVSDEASASADDDSDSDFSDKKRPTRTAKRGRRRQTTTTTMSKNKKNASIGSNTTASTTGSMKRTPTSLDVSSGDEDGLSSKGKKRKKSTNADGAIQEFPCDECSQVFHRKLSLVLHKKSHSNDRSQISCEICGKQFKIQGAYRTHVQKHKEEERGHPCEKCDDVYASRADLKRHLAEDHNEPGMVYTCKKCQRTFVSLSRLEKHITKCPGFTPKPKKPVYEGFPVGQDLFKSVAPLTTTYWSDSFSD